MNHDFLCVVSMIAMLIISAGLEGGAFTAGQAFALLIPAMALAIMSFKESKWYDR